MIEVPLDGYPGMFESYLKTTDNEEYKEHKTSEENGVRIKYIELNKITNTE
jgi:hypothetical protein